MSNQLPIIDIPKNACNVTTTEAEYDRAMLAQAEEQRKDPVGSALNTLKHDFKYNRFNSMYSYGDRLEFYMTQPEWKELEAKIAEADLPNLQLWTTMHKRYVWKLRLDLVKTRPNMAKRMDWYGYYLENKENLEKFCQLG